MTSKFLTARSTLSSTLLLSALTATTAVFAQAEPDVDGKNRPVWEAGLAAFGGGSPAYPGAEERVSRAIALPWFVYRGEVFRADGGTFGARVVKSQAMEIDIGFAGALGASSDDVEVRKGMPDLGFQFEFGPRARFILSNPTPDSVVRLEVPLRAVLEFKDGIKQRGFSFEPRLSYANRELGGGFGPGWGLTASASVVIGDRKLNQYLYGVDNAFATPTRSAYTAKSGIVSPRLQVALSHKLNKDVRLFGFTRYDFTGSGANKDSPLHIKNGGASFGLGAVWTIGRSSEMTSY